jgi:hypothetical protein
MIGAMAIRVMATGTMVAAVMAGAARAMDTGRIIGPIAAAGPNIAVGSGFGSAAEAGATSA